MVNGRIKNKAGLGRLATRRNLVYGAIGIIFVAAFLTGFGEMKFAAFETHPDWEISINYNKFDGTEDIWVQIYTGSDEILNRTLHWAKVDSGSNLVVEDSIVMDELKYIDIGYVYGAYVTEDFAIGDTFNYYVVVIDGESVETTSETRFVTFVEGDSEEPALIAGCADGASIEMIEDTTGNVISWTFTDDSPSTYSIVDQDEIEVATGTWESGVAINYTLDGLAVGHYQFTMFIRDINMNGRPYTVYVEVIEEPTPQDEIEKFINENAIPVVIVLVIVVAVIAMQRRR
jgi:hypothetical protein